MSLQKFKKIYFIGIGGIGISALAHILQEKGHSIQGSDSVKSEITENFKNKNIKINYSQIKENLNNDNFDLVIYTTAINQNHPELKEAKSKHIPCLSYPEALGEFSRDYKLIAISGTHGKSTVTAMLSKILIEANLDPTIVIGTKTKDLNNQNYRVGNSEYLLIEACEYKEAFLNFQPTYLVVNNLEPDHLDYFKTPSNYFQAFNKLAENIKPNGILITQNKFTKHFTSPKQSYQTITWENPAEFELQIPGKFNQENAQNAYTLAKQLQISDQQISKSLKNFQGSWRRMEYKKTKFPQTIFIDDYAHHPTEIKATLKAIKEQYPQKKVLTIFQPHQFNRTKHFLNQFAESFKDTTQVIIPNIYKVRDTQQDTQNLNPETLSQHINDISQNSIFIDGMANTAKFIQENTNNYDIIITMGAGDITDIYNYL